MPGPEARGGVGWVEVGGDIRGAGPGNRCPVYREEPASPDHTARSVNILSNSEERGEGQM